MRQYSPTGRSHNCTPPNVSECFFHDPVLRLRLAVSWAFAVRYSDASGWSVHSGFLTCSWVHVFQIAQMTSLPLVLASEPSHQCLDACRQCRQQGPSRSGIWQRSVFFFILRFHFSLPEFRATENRAGRDRKLIIQPDVVLYSVPMPFRHLPCR